MKTINLFVKFQFTNLSPDAQPISLGIVSDDWNEYPTREIGEPIPPIKIESKSIYCEFTDFDIERCDDWVKKYVVSKLRFNDFTDKLMYNLDGLGYDDLYDGNLNLKGNTLSIKSHLLKWLAKFSDYQVQFVCDCGTFDWYHLLKLIGEWETKVTENNEWLKYGVSKKSFISYFGCEPIDDLKIYHKHVVGIPKLPYNISPVPQDLNDLIAIKKGISVRDAFELNREELAFDWYKNMERKYINYFKEKEMEAFGFPGENKDQKHDALWDCKVIKAIYNQLK